MSPPVPRAPLVLRVRSSLGMRLSLLALALTVASSAIGCAKKPTMRVSHAEVSGVRFGFPPSVGVGMTVVVLVTNPNSYDVAIRAMRGTVTFENGIRLPIDFTAPPGGTWLAANQTTPLRAPAVLPIETALVLIREAYTKPAIPFHIVGHADVTATRTFAIEKDNYEVDEHGFISREQIEASLRALGIPVWPTAPPPPR